MGALLRSAGPLLSGQVKLKAKGRQVVIYDQAGRLDALNRGHILRRTLMCAQFQTEVTRERRKAEAGHGVGSSASTRIPRRASHRACLPCPAPMSSTGRARSSASQ